MNVYWAKTKGQGNPRLILRDLLATPEMSDVFGEKVFLFFSFPPFSFSFPFLFLRLLTAISEQQSLVLRALMGTPIGLNLRNVAWHGFFSIDEFWEGFLSFAIVLAVSLADVILPVLAQFPLRNLVDISSSFDTVCKQGDIEFFYARHPDGEEGKKDELPVLLQDLPVPVIEELFRRSFFPLRQNRVIYSSALEAFSNGDYYK